jgi:hypothetical protein
MVLRFPVPPATPQERRRQARRSDLHPPDPFQAVLTFAGAEYLLDVQLGRVTPVTDFYCRLFVNSWFPARNDTITDYTECTLPEYAAVDMVPDSWIPVDHPPEATRTYSTMVFNFAANGGGVTIYGFYLTEASGEIVIWAEAFQEPLSVPSLGTTLPLSVTWNDRGLRSH